ncbi:MAG: ACT domain-containing protein [bacterium]
MIKHQYTMYLENSPGALARITGILAKAKVNIEGISVAESAGAALVQLIAGDEAATKKALAKAKIHYTTQEVSVIVLPHRPGALASLSSKLQKARTHIYYAYATAADNDDQCCLVVSAEDIKLVEKIAKGFK